MPNISQTCSITGKPFTITEKAQEFYKSMNVPVPNICPEEGLRHVMFLRNERKLYNRKCDATGENIISAYLPHTPFPVYKSHVWWGDTWDGTNFGQNFDFSKSFFTQFFELRNKVPREGTTIINSENCDYNSHIRESKNCYLCSLIYRGEDCYYCYWNTTNKDLIDCQSMDLCELCYDSTNCEECFQCIRCQDCSNSNDCSFCYQLKGCDHCIFSSNLYRKSYYIFNKKVTPEEFKIMKEKIINGSYKQAKENERHFEKMWYETHHRSVHNLNCEQVIGDVMINSKNCSQSFQGWDCEDCYYSASLGKSKDVYYSYSIGWEASELVHYSSVVRSSTNIAFSYYIYHSNNLRYCDTCISCKDCFGCVGLRHKQYCILNKQYTKEQYEELVPKIIEYMKKIDPSTGSGHEWGQLPYEFSTFAYNETCAHDYFPLSKEEALKKGFRWSDFEASKPQVEKIIPAHKLPDNIKDIPDDILNWAIECEVTKKPFKIIKQELQFYRKHNLPLPRISPEKRAQLHNQRRNPYKLWERTCHKCAKEIQTTYAPDRKEIIYCEECYLKEVY